MATTANYCGPQYTGKNCQCAAQLVNTVDRPGVAREPICAYTKDNTQYPCDPGCCPTVCAPAAAATTTTTPAAVAGTPSTKLGGVGILLIVLGIIFSVLLVMGVVWASRRRKNLGKY